MYAAQRSSHREMKSTSHPWQMRPTLIYRPLGIKSNLHGPYLGSIQTKNIQRQLTVLGALERFQIH